MKTPTRKKDKEGYDSARLLRIASSPIRLLPDFLIIGTQKGGTTSLYNYLSQHPCIMSASKKEISFFAKRFIKDLNWYRSHFPSVIDTMWVKMRQGYTVMSGDASVDYLDYPHVPRRVFETLPQVKLIVLLRNPVDRAYSHYYHTAKRREVETLSFAMAIEAEADRLKGEIEKMVADESYYSEIYRDYGYLVRGIYVNQLKPWLDLFPREQMLILSSEDFFCNPATTVNQVFEFLNLPPWNLQDYQTYNRGRYHYPMAPDTRRKLDDYFAPYNQRLYEYLNMNFDWDTIDQS
jgi:hypothetical protein